MNRTTRQVLESDLGNESAPVHVIKSALSPAVNLIFRIIPPSPKKSIVQTATHPQKQSECSMCLNPADKQRPPNKAVRIYCCCPRCGFTVPNNRTDGADMSCDLCDNFHSTKLSLVRSHIAKVHNGSVTRLSKCSKCMLGFLSTEALERHKTVCNKLTKLKKPLKLLKPAAATVPSTVPNPNVIATNFVRKSVGIVKQSHRRQATKTVAQGCESSKSSLPNREIEIDENSDDKRGNLTKNGEEPPRKIRKISNVVNDVSSNDDPLDFMNDADHLDVPVEHGLQELSTSERRVETEDSRRKSASVESNGSEASLSVEIGTPAGKNPEDVVLSKKEFYCTCDGERDKDST